MRGRLRKTAIAVGMALVLWWVSSVCTGTASQQELLSNRLGVAILSFEDRTNDPANGHWTEGVPLVLTRELRAVKTIRLLSDIAIQHAFQENGAERGSPLDVNQARAIGECIEAQRVIWGHYQRDKDTWQVGLRVLNVATGKASEELVASGTDWFTMADSLADKTLAHLQIDPNQAEKARMRRRFTTSDRALEETARAIWLATRQRPESDQEAYRYWLARARVAGRDGHDDPAEAFLRKAIAIAPGDFQAHYSLGVLLQARKRDLEARKELEECVGAPLIAEDARRRLAQINEQLWTQQAHR